MDFCDLVWQLRSHFFFKDRDVTLQADRVFDGAGVIPIGGIIWWSGAIVDIPTGWALCDGAGGTVDLTDRFVVGAGNSYAVDDTGGSDTVDLQHSHGDGSYATDSDSHRHSGTSYGTSTPDGTPSTSDIGPGSADADWDHTHNVTGYTAYDSHSHDVTGTSDSALSTTEENRPPYYALAYIQRVS